uniref:Uncharacterized protein n=1 Tax=Candidatus Kentrum sp. FM TaxID=2126340 RepID=A0A450SPK2_9GAMM|nr:MAG: hypothetical protein BECKFM1743C_GA0114222_101532 [Candidatus Kentron sp. FM]VFJ55791.1 MAG: hypothetical protein BECKFM1743A_GA0114220_101557 [Candidatus Kentron sp. FM]VFK10974.1 MAG: hypothetical protein BECKFM1743B_GA0114221_101627 [Candidatus Kentron sp. FM]
MTVEAANTSEEGSSAQIRAEDVEYMVTKVVDGKFEKFLESVQKTNAVWDKAVTTIRYISIIISVVIGLLIVAATFYSKFLLDKGESYLAGIPKEIDEKITTQIEGSVVGQFRRKYREEIARLALVDSERTLLEYQWLGAYSRPIMEGGYIGLFEEILKRDDKYSLRLLAFMKRLFEYSGEREEEGGPISFFREIPIDKDIRLIRESENIRKAIDDLCESDRWDIPLNAMIVRVYYYSSASFDKIIAQLENILGGKAQDSHRFMEDNIEPIVISLAYRARYLEDSHKKDVLALTKRMENKENDLPRRVAGILSRLLLKMPGIGSHKDVDLSGELDRELHGIIGDDKERIISILRILVSHIDILYNKMFGKDRYIVTPDLVAKLYFEYVGYLSEMEKGHIQVSLKYFSTNERFYVELVPAVLGGLKPDHNLAYFVTNMIPDPRFSIHETRRIPILYAILESGERRKINVPDFDLDSRRHIFATEDETPVKWLKENGLRDWRVYFVTNPYFEDKEW